jgi:hypothetical protein
VLGLQLNFQNHYDALKQSKMWELHFLPKSCHFRYRSTGNQERKRSLKYMQNTTTNDPARLLVVIKLFCLSDSMRGSMYKVGPHIPYRTANRTYRTALTIAHLFDQLAWTRMVSNDRCRMESRFFFCFFLTD